MERGCTGSSLSLLDGIRDKEDPSSWWLQGSPALGIARKFLKDLPENLAQPLLYSKDLIVLDQALRSARDTLIKGS